MASYTRLCINDRSRRLDFAMLLPLLLGAALLWPGQANAGEVYRPRTGNTQWNFANGWNPQQLPGENDDVVLRNGTQACPLDLGNDHGIAINSLTVRGSSGLGWGITGDGTITTNTLQVEASGNGAAGMFAIRDGAALITDNTTIVAATLAIVNATIKSKTVNVLAGGNLDLSGSTPGGQSVLTGNTLTVAPGGAYKDDANSKVTLTGKADFTGNTTIKSKDFNSQGLQVTGNLGLSGDGGVAGEGARVNYGTGPAAVTGNLTLNNGSKLKGDGDLTVGGTYSDRASSVVEVGGDVLFKDTATINANSVNGVNPGFMAGGDLKTINDANLTLGDGANVLVGGAINVSGNLDLLDLLNPNGPNSSNTLSGQSLTVGKIYRDTTGSQVSIAGDVQFDGGATINANSPGGGSPGFTAGGGLTTGNGSTLSLGGGANVVVAGAIDVSGNLDLLQDNNKLSGASLKVDGVYLDGQHSRVAIAGDVQFDGGATINANSPDGVNPGFTAGGALTTSGSSLSLGDGANVAVVGAIDVHHNLDLSQNNNKLSGASLTVGDEYRDAANSTVILADNTATNTFNGLINVITGNLDAAGHVKFGAKSDNTLAGTYNAGGHTIFGADSDTLISGGFTANGGMTLDNSALAEVALTPGKTFNLAGDLILKEGASRTTTLNAVGVALPNLSSVTMEKNTQLSAGNISTTGNVSLGAESALTAGSLTVGGAYTDAPTSTVSLSGNAEFIGPAAVNSTFSAGGVASFAQSSTINSASFTSAGLTANNLDLGLGAFVQSTNTSVISGKLNMASHSALEAAGASISLGGNAGSTVTMAPGSQIRTVNSGDIYIGATTVAVDLTNRARDGEAGGSPALVAAGQIVFSNDARMLVSHSGNAARSGVWTLAQAGQGISFDTTPVTGNGRIDTVTLKGDFVLDPSDPTNLLFTGSYNPLSPGTWAFLSELSPNARRAAPGLANLVNNPGANPAAAALGGYTDAEFEAEMKRNLQGMTAEANVNHAAQTQRAHIEITNAALGYAFGGNAPVSAQGFVPNLHASLMRMGEQANPFQAQQRRGIMAARQRVSPAGPDGIPAQQHYSVLGNWQPAAQRTRQLVAQAAPPAPIAGMAAGASGIPGINVWGGYVGNSVQQRKKDGYTGYNANENGFLAGGSVEVAPELIVGVYGGWTTGQFSAQGVKADIDSNAIHFGAFFRFTGQQNMQGVNVTGDLAYSSISNDSTRTVPLAIGNQKMDASYNQYVMSGGLEAAYDYVPDADEYSRVTPFAAGRYSSLHQDGYTESGSLALKAHDMDNDQFTTTVGVRAARDFVLAGDSVIATPRVSAAWQRIWSDNRLTARSNFVGSPVAFDTSAVSMDKDAVQLGAGLDLRFKQDTGWDFGIKAAYGMDLRASSTGHTFFGGVEVNF